MSVYEQVANGLLLGLAVVGLFAASFYAVALVRRAFKQDDK